MNFNAVIAVLVVKNIITNEEGEALVEYINDRPQSTVLADMIAAVSEFIPPAVAAAMPQLGPVGPAQHAEEVAARTSILPPVPAEPVEPTPAPAEPAPAEPEKPAEKPETDKNSKPSSVKKPTDKPAKK